LPIIFLSHPLNTLAYTGHEKEVPTLSHLGLGHIVPDKSQEISDNKNTFLELPTHIEVLFSLHGMIAPLRRMRVA
jgi:hypothetical protein